MLAGSTRHHYHQWVSRARVVWTFDEDVGIVFDFLALGSHLGNTVRFKCSIFLVKYLSLLWPLLSLRRAFWIYLFLWMTKDNIFMSIRFHGLSPPDLPWSNSKFDRAYTQTRKVIDRSTLFKWVKARANSKFVIATQTEFWNQFCCKTRHLLIKIWKKGKQTI